MAVRVASRWVLSLNLDEEPSSRQAAAEKLVVLVDAGPSFPSGGVIHTESCPAAKRKKGKVQLTEKDSIENLRELGYPAKEHSCVK